jgi:Transglycosylase SLT domain
VSAAEQARFIWAIGQQESGGNYGAVNSSSGALGRWQVMPANLPSWESQCGMPQAGPGYYLSHPAYQNRLAACKLGRDYRAYGARGAAAVWYSGQPDWHATYGDPPVYQYVADVIAIMGGAPAGSGAGLGGATGAVSHTIDPPKEDYSPTVRAASVHVLHTGRALANTAIALGKLRG